MKKPLTIGEGIRPSLELIRSKLEKREECTALIHYTRELVFVDVLNQV